MYGEQKFLEEVQIWIKAYHKGPLLSVTLGTIITKEGVINKIKELGKLSWIDEELIQDQIDKLEKI